MKYWIYFISLSVFILLIACSSNRQDNPEHTFRESVEGGVLVVESSGGVRFPGEIFQFIRLLEIREDPGQSESLMSDLAFPNYSPDGRYYFLDVNSSRVVVFNADGSFNMAFGQEGEGPGDLLYPTSCSFHGETINIIQSMGAPRITRFRINGSLQDVITIPPPPSSGVGPRFDITSEGNILIYHYMVDMGEQFISRSACTVESTSR